ncbi:MAG TPA: DegV family protein [Clostridiales bacterium]|nr:DegV family protein [Clostridiales bacterium]
MNKRGENMAVILSADRTCDLSEALLLEFQVSTIPYHIHIGDREYIDNVNITPPEIFRLYHEKKVLPKTSAINTEEYLDYFRPWVEQGHEVLHFCLGGALSSSYQNCVLAGEELGHVYPINSCNLSGAIGLQVIDARKMLDDGMSAAAVQGYFNENSRRYHGSFILDTLEFLHAGGRCSSVAALSANLLNIKPCIVVDNSTGGMQVGKKYRGSLSKVLTKYVKDTLAQYDDILTDKVFITYSSIDTAIVDLVKETIDSVMPFDRVIETKASCTISSHCGPNTLGILFATKKPAK